MEFECELSSLLTISFGKVAKVVKRGKSVSRKSTIALGSDLTKSHIEFNDGDQTDSFDDVNARIKIGNNYSNSKIYVYLHMIL